MVTITKVKIISYKKNNGFTLIELLVVIAIIGLMSSIVLAALNSGRDKGSDASVKTQLVGIRSQAELYNTNNNTYVAMCTTDPNIAKMVTAARAAGGGVVADSPCNSNANTWAVSAKLKGGGFWCVDYLGKSKYEPSAIGGSITCP